MKYGYARVSTLAQEREGNSLEAQEARLKDAGAETIYKESCSGTTTNRPVLKALLGELADGDTLIATKLDRLGRSVVEVSQMIDDLLKRGVTVWTLDMGGPLDDSPMGRVMRTVVLAFAELERDLIVQRTQEGKAIAKQKPGYREGRKPKYTRAQYDHAMELLTENSYTQVSRMTGISKSALVKEHRKRVLKQ